MSHGRKMFEHVSESRSILVVDDDPLVLRMTEIVLDGMGFRVIVAPSGARALELLGDSENHFDLMVLDLRLPDIDGMKVLVASRRVRPELPVLAVTGYAVDDVLEPLRLAGARATLEKPYDVNTLSAAVRQALGDDGSGAGENA